VSSDLLRVIELALGGESDRFVVTGRFSVKAGRSSGLVDPRWRNRYVYSTCHVSFEQSRL